MVDYSTGADVSSFQLDDEEFDVTAVVSPYNSFWKTATSTASPRQSSKIGAWCTR